MEPVTEEQVDINTEVNKQPQQDIPLSEKLSIEEEDALKNLQKLIELEDEGVRQVKLSQWRKLDLYFNNIVNLFWNEDVQDWRIPDWDNLDTNENEIPPRTISIYRAHAETIISALSIQIPKVLFLPDDPDNSDDLETADTYTVTGEIIQKHNKAKMLLMKCLQIIFNQGTVFAYNYVKRDSKFGVHHNPVFGEMDAKSYEATCPQCGYDLGEYPTPQLNPVPCDQCQALAQPQNTEIPYKVSFQTGVERIPKHRILIDAFGPLNVKTSFYARSQAHCGYLTLKFDENVGFLRESFTEGEGALLTANDIQENHADAPFDSWVRYSPDYYGAQPMNTAVVKCTWLRSWMFNFIKDNDDLVKQLKKRFPNGAYLIFINDRIAEFADESLDDHWTISESPLSNFVHGEPLGTNLAISQDIRAEACELRLQTMEHSITETFVDNNILDKDKYEATRKTPGLITPVKRNPGEPLNQSFFETKSATMSIEANQMIGAIDADAQFVTGSLPSIYGGDDNPGGLTPVTATQYSTSRTQALKRLSITWQVLSSFWCEVIRKSTIEFLDNLEHDEKFAQRQGNGFKGLYIKKASLKGKIGSVEAESSDQLPLSWDEQKNVITSLLTMNDETIKAVLLHPENADIMKQVTGIPNFYIPGDDSRTRQYCEAKILITSEPIQGQMSGPDGKPEMEPSLMPESTDDDKIHMIICSTILNSARGWELKQEETASGRPGGYTNLVLHYHAHEKALMEKTLQANANTPPGQAPDSAAPHMAR